MRTFISKSQLKNSAYYFSSRSSFNISTFLSNALHCAAIATPAFIAGAYYSKIKFEREFNNKLKLFEGMNVDELVEVLNKIPGMQAKSPKHLFYATGWQDWSIQYEILKNHPLERAAYQIFKRKYGNDEIYHALKYDSNLKFSAYDENNKLGLYDVPSHKAAFQKFSLDELAQSLNGFFEQQYSAEELYNLKFMNMALRDMKTVPKYPICHADLHPGEINELAVIHAAMHHVFCEKYEEHLMQNKSQGSMKP